MIVSTPVPPVIVLAPALPTTVLAPFAVVIVKASVCPVRVRVVASVARVIASILAKLAFVANVCETPVRFNVSVPAAPSITSVLPS